MTQVNLFVSGLLVLCVRLNSKMSMYYACVHQIIGELSLVVFEVVGKQGIIINTITIPMLDDNSSLFALGRNFHLCSFQNSIS